MYAQLTSFPSLKEKITVNQSQTRLNVIGHDKFLLAGYQESRAFSYIVGINDQKIIVDNVFLFDTIRRYDGLSFQNLWGDSVIHLGSRYSSLTPNLSYLTLDWYSNRDLALLKKVDLSLVTNYPDFNEEGYRSFNTYRLNSKDTAYYLSFYATEVEDVGLRLCAIAKNNYALRTSTELPQFMRGRMLSGTVTDTSFFFTSTAQFFVDQYNLNGNYMNSFNVGTWDVIEGGTSLTGFYSENVVVNFDNSLYYFGASLLYQQTEPPGINDKSAFSIIRVDKDFNLLNRIVVDTQTYNNSTLQPLFLNRATSVSPDGRTLWFIGQGSTASNVRPGTRTWYLHSFGPDFERRADLDLPYRADNDTLFAEFDGIVALDDGGCLLYGRNIAVTPNTILVYRLDAQGNAVSALVPPGPEAQALFAHPNPLAVGEELRIDLGSLPSQTRTVEVYDLLGRVLGQLEFAEGPHLEARFGGWTSARLPEAADHSPAPMVLVAKDASGRGLVRQVILR